MCRFSYVWFLCVCVGLVMCGLCVCVCVGLVMCVYVSFSYVWVCLCVCVGLVMCGLCVCVYVLV